MNANRKIHYQVVLDIPTDTKVGIPMKQVFPGSVELGKFMKPGGITYQDILEGCVLNEIPANAKAELEIYHTNTAASRLIWKTLWRDESETALPEESASNKMAESDYSDFGEPEKESD